MLWAKFPTQPEEIKVGDFVGKLLPRYRNVMAYQFPKTTREAINLAKMAEERLENEEHERLDLEERVRSRAPERVIHEWADKAHKPSNRPPPPPKNGQRNRQEVSQDYRNNEQRASAFQQPRPQQPAARPQNNFRNNSAVPMEVDMAQQRSTQCFKCGGHGHMARDCRSQPPPQSNMIEKTTAATPKISTQRPANRVGFNVDAQAVQRPPAPRKIVTPVRPNNETLLDEASITMPFTGFTKLPGMNRRVTNYLTGTRPAASLARATETDIQEEREIEDHRNGFATMRIMPGSVSPNGQPSDDTVLDSGASFSMDSRNYVKACGMEQSLVETQLTFTTADGNTAGANNMLTKTKIQVGLCTYEMKLVVADNPRFDLLLGVDFLDASNANIRMDLRKVLLTGVMDAQQITEPLRFTVGKDSKTSETINKGTSDNEIYTGEMEQNSATTNSEQETEAGVAVPHTHPPSTTEIPKKTETLPNNTVKLPEKGFAPVLPRTATGTARPERKVNQTREPIPQPTATNNMSLAARLRKLADQIDSSNEAEPTQAEATNEAINTEAEEAQAFIDALRQVSGSTSEDPAEPIAIPEAGVDPLSSRLQQIWEEQWRMFDVSAASAKQHLHKTIDDPQSDPARVAAAKRALAFKPSEMTTPSAGNNQQKITAQQREERPNRQGEQSATVKGLTGSEEGVDKAKRPKINPATPQTCTKNRTVCHYHTTTGPPCHCEQCKQDYRQDRREIIEEYKEKRRIATYVLASRETEEALSEAEAEAKAEECETEETTKPTTEADKEAAEDKRAAEEDKLKRIIGPRSPSHRNSQDEMIPAKMVPA